MKAYKIYYYAINRVIQLVLVNRLLQSLENYKVTFKANINFQRKK